jgi:hypothetical protein
MMWSYQQGEPAQGNSYMLAFDAKVKFLNDQSTPYSILTM